jgi:hypothetical protein
LQAVASQQEDADDLLKFQQGVNLLASHKGADQQLFQLASDAAARNKEAYDVVSMCTADSFLFLSTHSSWCTPGFASFTAGHTSMHGTTSWH